jgi:hypothetical protein
VAEHVSEHDIQSTFIAEMRLRAKIDPRLAWVHSIPNAARRGYVTRCRMLDEGLRAGVADVFLPCPSGQYHGLYIEFKAGRNTCTAEQVAFGEYAQAAGYGWVVARNVDEAVTAVERYLESDNAQ